LVESPIVICNLLAVAVMKQRSLLSVMVLTILSGCGWFNASTPYEKAYEQFSLGNWDEAIHQCNRLLQLGPDNPTAIMLRGRSLAGNGDLDDAIKDFTLVIEIQPEDAEAYYHRGLAYRKLGQIELADADKVRGRELDELLKSAYQFEPSSRSSRSKIAQNGDDEDVGSAEQESHDDANTSDFYSTGGDEDDLAVADDESWDGHASSGNSAGLDSPSQDNNTFGDGGLPTPLTNNPLTKKLTNKLPTVENPTLPSVEMATATPENPLLVIPDDEPPAGEKGKPKSSALTDGSKNSKDLSVPITLHPEDDLKQPLNRPPTFKLSTSLQTNPADAMALPNFRSPPKTGVSLDRLRGFSASTPSVTLPQFHGNPIYDPSLDKPKLSTALSGLDGAATITTANRLHGPGTGVPTGPFNYGEGNLNIPPGLPTTFNLPGQGGLNPLGPGLPVTGNIGRVPPPFLPAANLGTGNYRPQAPPPTTGIQNGQR